MMKILKYTLIVLVMLGTGYFLMPKNDNQECTTDNQCKLIYNGCSCEAVSISDTRTFLEETGMQCEVNGCEQKNIKAICNDNQCVRSDSVNN